MGKTQIFTGSGKDLTIDRKYISMILHDIMCLTAQTELKKSRQRAVIKDVTVYLPCKLLERGGELIDAPGT
jgi:hypothetical protein